MSTPHIMIEISNEMARSPLSALDKFIVDSKKINPTQKDERLLLNIFCKDIAEHLSLEVNSENYIDEVFRDNIGIINQEFISICFLRLLNNNASILNGYKIKIFNLFDKTLKEVYRIRNISEKDQNFVKENKLQDFIPTIERSVFGILNDIVTLKEFNHQKFRSTLHKNDYKKIFKPFLPTNYERDIDNIFKKINIYNEASIYEKAELVESLSVDIESSIKLSTEFNTIYSENCITKPFCKIQDLLNEEIAKNPINKSATLSLKKTDKKYPFTGNDNHFNISFLLIKEGEGYAYNTKVEILETSNGLLIDKKVQILGKVTANQRVDFVTVNISREEYVIVTIKVTWSNYNKTTGEKIFDFELQSQNLNIEWDDLTYETPFSTNAVETEERLIGRKEILQRLFVSTRQSTTSSFYLYGQKRVGKSSIAKTLKNKILKDKPKDYIIVYLEAGEFKSSQPSQTIDELVKKICRQVQMTSDSFTNIKIPELNGSFSAITDFFDQVISKSPNTKVFIILDEFDQINPELYGKTEVGDSFFLAIRALSNKSNIGFLLVGGELMNLVISNQGTQINLFNSIIVDYFDKNEHWIDFQDLVRKPISVFEINDEAINLLYEYTAGNPYFTVIICENLFKYMTEKRDNYVTTIEMQIAINIALKNSRSNVFSHFWDDGIAKVEIEREKISINRRKLLMAISNLIRDNKALTENNISDIAIKSLNDEAKVKAILREYCERKVLLDNYKEFSFKVKFFEEWLASYGIDEIILTFSDSDREEQKNKIEEEAAVTSKEVLNLISDWKTYKSRQITTDIVRHWLMQFGENTKQRLMFKILQSVRFYNDYLITQKLEDIGKYVIKDLIKRGSIKQVGNKANKRNDILVSYLDQIGKSGAEYAKKFADSLDIYFDNVVEKDKIFHAIEKNTTIKALVFIDDFIGTGNSVCEYFTELYSNYPEIFLKEEVTIHLGIICGFDEAKQKINEHFVDLGIKVTITLIDILSDSDRCFSETSLIFPNIVERQKARNICYEYGNQITNNRDYAFGYSGSQATVVFSNTCPNNSLPILWKKTPNWQPIFER